MSQQFSRVLRAFLSGKPARAGHYSTTGETLFYYSSPILLRAPDGTISFSCCGRPSVTAKRCINAFLQEIGRMERLRTSKGQLFWGETPINGTDRYTI